MQSFVDMVRALPRCTTSFAYGSGVFSQGASSQLDATRLVDLVVVVDDAEQWHAQNMTRNPSHYPRLLRAVGARGVAKLQRVGGARMLFFPYSVLAGVRCKYGVIATEDFVRDLTEWDTLYCSGRLHKPVAVIDTPPPQVSAAMSQNLSMALCAGVLEALEREGPLDTGLTVSDESIFLNVAGLSYRGDVRMALGESPNKVADIVRHNMDGFRAIYRKPLEQLCREQFLLPATNGQQHLYTVSPLATALLTHLPRRYADAGIGGFRLELEQTVRATSGIQTLKGFASAGVTNSLKYGVRKVMKRFHK